jgi:hypothetical protein
VWQHFIGWGAAAAVRVDSASELIGQLFLRSGCHNLHRSVSSERMQGSIEEFGGRQKFRPHRIYILTLNFAKSSANSAGIGLIVKF